jgi:hypothetical protein
LKCKRVEEDKFSEDANFGKAKVKSHEKLNAVGL